MNHTMPKHVKAATVNAIRREADKRLAAEFAQRRIELAAKLDAIPKLRIPKLRTGQAGQAFTANKAAPDGTLQRTIDYGAELQELEDGMADDEFNRRGC